jgi:hypothetical protein
MVRALALSFMAITVFAVIATPGLAGAALLIVPFAVLASVWWITLGAAAPGRRSEVAVRVRHREFLGPGGPDDPFAGNDPAGGRGFESRRSKPVCTDG